jgi:hypothetical protein
VNAALAERLAAGVTSPAFRPIWSLPSAGDLQALLDAPGVAQALVLADEIASGQVRLFGELPARLEWPSSHSLPDWTAFESGAPAHIPSGAPPDIKFAWEPARFGWVYPLGRAYLLTGDERYPQVFWEQAEAFLDANPPYLGPQWASAQETALRLIAFTFALQVFQPSAAATRSRVLRLLQSAAVHAGRIPPTLSYARAQDNNHLLSEAAGLAAAAALLPNHPQAARWRRIGWSEFQDGLRSQIAQDGAYSQHSANYHRLALQLGVWMHTLARLGEPGLDAAAQARLAAATRWLLALVDPASGGTPNLGPNDGGYLFPFSSLPIGDYRPTLQAAGLAFLGRRPFPPGVWDEMPAWLDADPGSPHTGCPAPAQPADPLILRAADGRSWVYLRAARFSARPGHADQLHLDLWRDGVNIAQDAGTYLYNAPPPWDNALAGSHAHNTVTVDGLNQMRRAGRFLFVEWAQAETLPAAPAPGFAAAIAAEHNGYRRLGLTHRRLAQSSTAGDWRIEDTLCGPAWQAGRTHRLTLHWLLPDWLWQVQAWPGEAGMWLRLQPPAGELSFTALTLGLQAETATGGAIRGAALQISRAGETIHGEGHAEPTWGWASPTYGVKVPALSVRYSLTVSAETRFITNFRFE